MAKRIATMLLNKGNSRSSSVPPQLLSGKQRSFSMPEIPESPYIAGRYDRSNTSTDLSFNRPFREMPFRSQSKSLPKTTSLKSLSSLVANRREYKSDILINEKPKPGEPILVSARHKTSRSGSVSCPYYLLDLSAKQLTSTDVVSVCFDSTQFKNKNVCGQNALPLYMIHLNDVINVCESRLLCTNVNRDACCPSGKIFI